MGRVKASNGTHIWRRVSAASVAAFLCISALGTSFASSLLLSPPTQPALTHASRCSSAPAVVTLKDGKAEVVVPEECADHTTYLHLGTNSETTSIPIGPGSGVVTVDDDLLSPEAVLVTSDTWPLMTELIADETSPVEVLECRTPSGTCDIKINSLFFQWPGDSFWLVAEFSSSSPVKEQWEVTINLSSPELLVPNTAPIDERVPATWLGDAQDGLVKVGSTACSADPRTVTVKGTTSWGEYNYIGGGLPSKQLQVFGSLSLSNGSALIDCR